MNIKSMLVFVMFIIFCGVVFGASPSITNVILNTTDGNNYTSSTLIAYEINVTDADNDTVTTFYTWYRNNTLFSNFSDNVVMPELYSNLYYDFSDFIIDTGNGSDGAYACLSGTCTLNTTANLGGWDFTNFTVNSGTTVNVVGDYAVQIRISGTAQIAGTININGQDGQDEIGAGAGGAGGPGAVNGGDGGGGGGCGPPGGDYGNNGTGTGHGEGGADNSGGGGAGHAYPGTDGTGALNGSGGIAYGNLTSLTGGSGGGGGGGTGTCTTGGGGGGGGGGAILLSGNDINIVSSALINADGGNGGFGAGSGGGGSGGTIMILGTSVNITGNLSASGGNGNNSGGTGSVGRIIIASLSLSVSGNTYPTYNDTTSYYTDEDYIIDKSPNNNNGSIVNSVSIDLNGPFGDTAATFSSGGYLNISDDNSLDFNDTDEFSLSVWVKTPGNGGAGSMPIFQKGASPYFNYNMYITSTGGLSLGIWSPDGAQTVTDATINLTDDEWHHVVATVRGNTANQVSFYLDGENILNSGTAKRLAANNGELLIGHDGITELYVGVMDEVRIYSTSLSSEEVNALYRHYKNRVLPPLGLGVYKTCVTPFDGTNLGNEVCSNNVTITSEPNNLPYNTYIYLNSTSGVINVTEGENLTLNYTIYDADSDPTRGITTWYKDSTPLATLYLPFDYTNSFEDFSGNGNDAIEHTAGWSQNGYIFGGVDFDTSGDLHLTVEDSASLDSVTSEGTIMLWAKQQFTGSLDIYVVKNSGANHFTTPFGLGYEGGISNGYIAYLGTGSSGWSLTTPFTVDTNWHHVAFTWSDSGNWGRIYVDGGLNASNSMTITPVANNANLSIGVWTGYSSWSTDAVLDEIRIYDYAMTDNEIRAIYENETNIILNASEGVWQGCVTPTDGYGIGATNCSDGVNVTEGPTPPILDNNLVCDNSLVCEYQNLTSALQGENNTNNTIIIIQDDVVYTLDNNTYYYTGNSHWIEINNSNNIEINGYPTTLIMSGTGTAIYFRGNSTNNKIRELYILNGDIGVSFEDNGTYTKTQVSDCIISTYDYGIYMNDKEGLTIFDNSTISFNLITSYIDLFLTNYDGHDSGIVVGKNEFRPGNISNDVKNYYTTFSLYNYGGTNFSDSFAFLATDGMHTDTIDDLPGEYLHNVPIGTQNWSLILINGSAVGTAGFDSALVDQTVYGGFGATDCTTLEGIAPGLVCYLYLIDYWLLNSTNGQYYKNPSYVGYPGLNIISGYTSPDNFGYGFDPLVYVENSYGAYIVSNLFEGRDENHSSLIVDMYESGTGNISIYKNSFIKGDNYIYGSINDTINVEVCVDADNLNVLNGGSQFIFSDDFNRANGAPGNNWINGPSGDVSTSNWQIYENNYVADRSSLHGVNLVQNIGQQSGWVVTGKFYRELGSAIGGVFINVKGNSSDLGPGQPGWLKEGCYWYENPGTGWNGWGGYNGSNGININSIALGCQGPGTPQETTTATITSASTWYEFEWRGGDAVLSFNNSMELTIWQNGTAKPGSPTLTYTQALNYNNTWLGLWRGHDGEAWRFDDIEVWSGGGGYIPAGIYGNFYEKSVTQYSGDCGIANGTDYNPNGTTVGLGWFASYSLYNYNGTDFDGGLTLVITDGTDFDFINVSPDKKIEGLALGSQNFSLALANVSTLGFPGFTSILFDQTILGAFGVTDCPSFELIGADECRFYGTDYWLVQGPQTNYSKNPTYVSYPNLSIISGYTDPDYFVYKTNITPGMYFEWSEQDADRDVVYDVYYNTTGGSLIYLDTTSGLSYVYDFSSVPNARNYYIVPWINGSKIEGYGFLSPTFNYTPPTTEVNLSLDMIYPPNGTTFSLNETFVSRANLTNYGTENATNCNATIVISDSSVINVSTGFSLFYNIGIIGPSVTLPLALNCTTLSYGTTDIEVLIECSGGYGTSGGSYNLRVPSPSEPIGDISISDYLIYILFVFGIVVLIIGAIFILLLVTNEGAIDLTLWTPIIIVLALGFVVLMTLVVIIVRTIG